MAFQHSTPKYILRSPDMEMIGQAMLGIMESPELEEFYELVLKYNFNRINPTQWYRMDHFMEFYRELMNHPNASSIMISIGVKAFNHVVLPDGIHTVQDAIRMLNATRPLNLRNLDEDDWYIIQEITPQYFQVIESTPFPHDLIYGYLYGLTRRLCPKGMSFFVRRGFLNHNHPDSDGAVYEIELT